MKTWKKYKWVLLGGLFLICLVFGVWGLVETGKRFLDACYLTMQMITLNVGFDDGEKTWKVEMARFVLPMIVGYTALAAIWILAQQHISTFRLRLFVNDHFVICGLGDRGMALARDLIAKKLQLVAIEIDPNNSNRKAFSELGGILIEGDAREASTLQDAKIGSASKLVLLTNSDVTNLNVFSQALLIQGSAINKKPVKDQTIHVHLASRENRALFDVNGIFFPPKQRKGLEIGIFNVHENAAIELFQDNVLGANVDTVTPKAAPVSLLIVGFGCMGEAVLVEAMQLGHFCNREPISITVVVKDAAAAQQRFLQNYREVSNHLGEKGLKLWNLSFIQTIDQVGPLSGYSDIISCDDDEDIALVNISELWDRWQCEERPLPSTRFFQYSPNGRDISNTGVIAFGEFDRSCNSNHVIARQHDVMGKAKSDMYAKTVIEQTLKKDSKLKIDPKLLARARDMHCWEDVFMQYDAQTDPPIPQDKKLTWKNMSLHKRASNLTELRHYGIKLHALGLNLRIDSKSEIDATGVRGIYPYLKEFPDIEPVALELIRHSLIATQLSEDALMERIHLIATAEHNRWNAFHVLNNFRYDPKPKNEVKRTHDCLLRWEELIAKKPDVLKYDYQNVYQMLGILRLKMCGVTSIHPDNPE